MDYNYSERYDVWLVFKSAHGYWLNKFLKRGFGHVLFLTKDKYNWFYLDPHQLRLTYGISPYETSVNVPRLLRNEGFTVVKITFFDRATHRKLRYSHLCTCVSFVKYAMGISIRCLTPYGLFKKLLTLTEKQKFKNGIVQVKNII